VVSARDEGGHPLAQLEGPALPGWAGAQAGLPGTAYAKVLQDVATGDYPVTSYWKQSRIISDNRIPALGTALSRYTFATPPRSGWVTVTAELLFRRNFQAEMDARGWEAADIPMEQSQAEVTVWVMYLPLLQ
jgi:hypothetical protein